jgi:hypothetical protein
VIKFQSLKDLIVVLALALVIFRFARPIALRFSSESDFARRRNAWLALTVVAFLSPSFWLFVLVAIPVLISARRKDSNPVALYMLLLHVIPPLPLPIPVVGINELFDLDGYRLLSFCILIPVALQLRQRKDPARIAGLQAMDFLLLASGALYVGFYVPPDLPNHIILPDSMTNVLRRTLLFLVDTYALYFVVSRGCATRSQIVDTMASFCLGCAIMALIAAFESVRHWLLYADIQMLWTGNNGRLYLERGGLLRAQASTGHSLALGGMLAIAFGFWLHLQTHVDSRRSRLAVTLLLWLGLVAAYSRGPWLGAVAIYLAFMALGPGAFGRIFKAGAVIAVALWIVSLTPLGARIAQVLPFFGGSVDNANVVYRQKLADRSMQLIREHPFFGDQRAFSKMEDLRQGEGIIDLVNSYAEVAVFHGLVGLFLFVGLPLLAILRAYRVVRNSVASDADLAGLGTSLIACILGTMLMLVDASFLLGYEKMFYVLAGLAAAYAHLRRAPSPLAAAAVAGASEIDHPVA